MNLENERILYRAKAFTNTMSQGNPAGVVFGCEGFTDRQKIILARELNTISETVFIGPGSGGAGYRLRYFTSECEVDVCGHATIAALFALAWTGEISAESGTVDVPVETRVGPLFTRISFSGGLPEYAIMEQLEPQVVSGPDPGLAADVLGLPDSAIERDFPPLCGYTGLWACFVPLSDVAWLEKISPDQNRICELMPENPDLTGVYPFAFIDETTTQGRFIVSPGYGIDEDPVTGTACGALGGCLYFSGRISKGNVLLARQGYEIGQGGTVRVEYGTNGRIRIGGTALPVFSGTLVSEPS